MNGQRLYYEHASIDRDPRLNLDVANLFNIKQRVERSLLDDMIDLEFTGTTIKQLKLSDPTDLIMDRLKDEIKERTWNNAKRKLSESITYNWPACPFDEWAEETFDFHWMTAEWYKGEHYFSDYSLLVRVFVPVLTSREEFDSDYGQNFIMTKLSYDFNDNS